MGICFHRWRRLVIQIKENEDGLADNSIISRINDQSTDIIADIDCTITNITTRTGIAQVKKGVQVKKGDLLVSGQIPICNDANRNHRVLTLQIGC